MNKLKLYRPGGFAWNTTEETMQRFDKAYNLYNNIHLMREKRLGCSTSQFKPSRIASLNSLVGAIKSRLGL